MNQDLLDVFPSEIRQPYEKLSWDVIHLHRKWKIIRELYVSGETVIELLNKTSPGFFRICKDVFVDDLFLSIRRLTDPKSTGNKTNLTLDYLKDCIDSSKYSQLRIEVDQLLANCSDKCTFAREHSNLRIAHSDFQTRLQVTSLSSPTTTHVEDALQSIRSLMNAIEKHFHRPIYCDDVNIAYVDYANVVTVDAFRLLNCLREWDTNPKN